MNIQVLLQTDKLILQIKEKGGYTSEETQTLIRSIREKVKSDEAERQIYSSLDSPFNRFLISFRDEIDDKAWEFAYQICKDFDSLLDDQPITFDEAVAWVKAQDFYREIGYAIKDVTAQRIRSILLSNRQSINWVDRLASISPRKTFYLWESSNDAEVAFEVEPDGSVRKIWPSLEKTNLKEADLEAWLAKDLIEGRDSMCRQIPQKSENNTSAPIAQEERTASEPIAQ